MGLFPVLNQYVDCTPPFVACALESLSIHFCCIFFLFYSALSSAGSPQQREPIAVGPYYITNLVDFPCGRKPEYPEKTRR